MRRPPLRAGVVAVFAALLAIGATTAAAGAPRERGRPGTSCAHYSGRFPLGPITLSGCTNVRADGGTGTLDNRTGVITWSTGKTTSISATLTPVSKDEKEKHGCPPTAAFEVALTGSVTADTTGTNPVGGPVTAELCGRESETIQNEPGTQFVLR
ncbi:MAG: hypothetical protein JO368_05170 [Acidimicrobiales bacterium]|nr:hypothetical protein [Acidimicrobiales bacterium]